MTGDKEAYDRLIDEVMTFLPKYTWARGGFNSMPEMGYDARHPGEWQKEFLGMLDAQYLGAFKPNTNDIVGLVEFLNRWPTLPLVQALDLGET